MAELVAIGGHRPLMKMLLDAGLLHGDCLTVTGKTMAENLKNVKPYPEGQDIIRPFDNPIKKDSHLRDPLRQPRPGRRRGENQRQGRSRFSPASASVFDPKSGRCRRFSTARSWKATSSSSATKGPRADPACAKCCARPAPSWARASGQGGADHRWPFLRRQPRFRRRPHHARSRAGRPARDRAKWRSHHHRRTQAQPDPGHQRCRDSSGEVGLGGRREPKATRGVLGKYAANVSSASYGAVTEPVDSAPALDTKGCALFATLNDALRQGDNALLLLCTIRTGNGQFSQSRIEGEFERISFPRRAQAVRAGVKNVQKTPPWPRFDSTRTGCFVQVVRVELRPRRAGGLHQKAKRDRSTEWAERGTARIQAGGPRSKADADSGRIRLANWELPSRRKLFD